MFPPPPFGPPPMNGHSNGAKEAMPNPLKSRSEESINMKFSPSDWHGKFEGQADYFAPAMPKGTFGKGRTSPTRGRSINRTASEKASTPGRSQPPPPRSPFSQDPPEMPPPPPRNNNLPPGTASAPHSAKFAPKEWAETFKESGWAYPVPTPKKDTSPRRASVATAKRKPVTLPNGTSQSDTPHPVKQPFVEEESDDAMEIDSSTPPVVKPRPLAPEARARATRKSSGPAAPSQAKGQPQPPATSPVFDSLAGLAKVEPFQPSTAANGDALDGLADLKSTLPFESKAAPIPASQANIAARLKTPMVPAAPVPPSTLEKVALTNYLTNMEKYVKSFNEYNQVMIEHFVSRQSETRQLDPHFINCRGDPHNKPGLDSYIRGVKQDTEVLQSWKIAQGMHLQALEKCREIRGMAMDRFVKK
ncbi:hypothetical protein BCR34DRAFT_299209 [Clohesyomyces aquaticus]|uniref:Uncharacterized protein n=1 Tax=Clohesyomyces aquaticus TaxID=1231657 RepID=A0A1Y1XZS7_9PLEO|nr:hypothetical protein BCR34DRAFT_299209 [Clohesyomyces aquaticus]